MKSRKITITVKDIKKNKLVKNVSDITWHELKALALDRGIEINEMLEILVSYFKKHND